MGETYIVTFKDGTSPARTVAGASAVGAQVIAPLTEVFDGAIVRATKTEAQRLAARPDVVRVTPDRVVTGSAETQSSAPWGLDRVDQRALPLNRTFTYGPSGHGITAYIIDSGINANHTEFGGRVAPGVVVQDIGTTIADCHGHGTHTSGTVAGRTYGVAKSATIVPVRVLDCQNSGTVSGFVSGMDWVVKHHRPGQPAVANLSLGAPAVIPELDRATRALINDGVTVVVAAGNSGQDACQESPGRLPAAITVGATTASDTRAPYSNYGTCLDTFAPGDQILSAAYDSNTGSATMSGTSMATPHVAGAVAQYLERHRTATPAQVTSALLGAATTGRVKSPGARSPNRLLYTAGFTAEAASGSYWPVGPNRILDTRTGNPVAANSSRTIAVRGRGGVPMNASAVVLNVTVTQPRTAGNVVVHPAGIAAPTASNLNFVPGQTVANLVTVRLGTNGQVTLRNNAGGSSHLIADVAGYYVAGTPTAAGTYQSLVPARAFDSRTGTKLAPNESRAVQITGRSGVPSAVGAVVVNLTVTQPTRAGHLTAYPSGTPAPSSSNVNFGSGETRANQAVVKVGSDGRISLLNSSAGSTHAIVDIAGYYLQGTPTLPGTFVALNPARLYDSRPNDPVAAATSRYLPVGGRAGVPSTGVTAAALNVTVTSPTSAGNLTGYPHGRNEPGTSNLNFVAGSTVPNAVMAELGEYGAVRAKNSSKGTIHLVADVFGYFKS
ncbi:S8 family peptidase [Nigerium massiliense]|uniref:S8 family peptidase n=1 Tax=Nigerium massiliense TaxID=1522317 RepID=UPI000AE80AFA|nr:S8 family peptidase [Nigerium massiliense]